MADSYWRVDLQRVRELVRLHRIGLGARAVAQRLGISPNTERRYRRALHTAGLLTGSPSELPALAHLHAALLSQLPVQRPPQHESSVEPWRELILERWIRGEPPGRIHAWLRDSDAAFQGSLSAVKRMCLRLLRERRSDLMRRR